MAHARQPDDERPDEPLDLRARRFDRKAAAQALAPLIAEALEHLTDDQLRELLRRRAERRARRQRDVKSV